MKLGYNTWSMPETPFGEAVRMLARIGYDSVEVTVCEGWPTDAETAADADIESWRVAAMEQRLEISSVTANAPLVCDDDTWVASRRRLLRSFEVAAILGAGTPLPVSLGAHKPKAPLLGGNPPPIIAQNSWESDRAQIIDRFGDLAEQAVAIGCTVALEPHAGAVVSTPEQAIAVLDGVGSDALGINLDVSHFAVRDFDLAEVVSTLLPRTVVVEVKDHRRTADGFDFLTPGEGEFDHAGFLRLLDEGGYRGTVSVEISVRRQALPDFDERSAAELSYRTLSDAARSVGVVRAGGVRS
ncbi:sugar phosphate isomerase/epimerase [Microbacterium esteraromaticum]|uniref:Sugar phosphate isomerase/epimerase n=1 Tax=Microbacterium esteraromaticum TaxID=57043 RepID=A0A7D8A9H8_9MICO|nr:sugar phosphate isomerase/epimerase family protein [Microbacterium esteraromaticum]QMU96441.1 sugar phosphate isomerase/epimerase [Microbacterium esteraromaticum]